MCDLNVRDTQTGARETEGTQRGPGGPPCSSSTSHKREKVIPLWPQQCVFSHTHTHPFSVPRSSTYGLNYCLTYQSAQLLYGLQSTGFIKAHSVGASHATRLVILVKQKQRKVIPSDTGGTQQKEKENMDKIKKVTEKFSIIQSW